MFKAASPSLARKVFKERASRDGCCKQQTRWEEGRQGSSAKVPGRLPGGGTEWTVKAALRRALGLQRAPDTGHTPQHDLTHSPTSQPARTLIPTRQGQDWGSERLTPRQSPASPEPGPTSPMGHSVLPGSALGGNTATQQPAGPQNPPEPGQRVGRFCSQQGSPALGTACSEAPAVFPPDHHL